MCRVTEVLRLSPSIVSFLSMLSCASCPLDIHHTERETEAPGGPCLSLSQRVLSQPASMLTWSDPLSILLSLQPGYSPVSPSFLSSEAAQRLKL